MERKILLVGDPPICGGRVLPYQASFTSTIHDHHVALIGGRAYCEGCNSVGVIAKTGGPRRMEFVSEVALEGDVVVCQCPEPQPLRAVLQASSTYDDGWETAPDVPDLMALPRLGGERETAALKRAVDEDVKHPPEAEQIERICPNMTNREFADLMMKIRDRALYYIEEKRLTELRRWDRQAQALVKAWFGVADQKTRDYLIDGLTSCASVLRNLKPRNFIRYVEGGRVASCELPSANGAAAAVCRPDLSTRTIAIADVFCGFAENIVNFDTGEVMDGDSKLLTLIHEVTHFEDTFNSEDTWYGTRNSRRRANSERPTALLRNADSIASYVLGVQ